MDEHAVRAGISAAVDSIAGVTCTPYVPDAITEPHFFVAESETTFDLAHRRALDSIQFTCRILVGRADDLSAQRILNGFTSGSGTNSLKVAIESVRTHNGGTLMSGAIHDIVVRAIRAHRFYEHAGVEYLGAELDVYVIGSGV